MKLFLHILKGEIKNSLILHGMFFIQSYQLRFYPNYVLKIHFHGLQLWNCLRPTLPLWHLQILSLIQ